MSSDHGDSWIPVRTQIGSLVTSLKSSKNQLFAGTVDKGVYLSIDKGMHWKQINSGLLNVHVWSLTIGNDMIYVGTEDGIFCSSNTGESWASLGLRATFVCSLAFKDTLLFAGTLESGVFRLSTNDSGWIYLGLDHNRISAIEIGSGRVFAGSAQNGLFYSSDYGMTWTNNRLLGDVEGLFADDSTIVAGTGEGARVFVSYDLGNNWSVRYLTSAVNTLIGQGNNFYAGLTRDGIFRSTNRGNEWALTNRGITGNVTSGVANGADFIVGTVFGGIFSSSNNGLSWNRQSQGGIIGAVSAFAIMDSCFFAVSSFGLFRSTNRELEWTMVHGCGDLINCMAVSGNMLYAGSSAGVCSSSDSGKTWTQWSGTLSSNLPILSLIADGDELFAGTSQGVYMTANRGRNWTAAGLGTNAVSALSYSKGNLIAGTSQGDAFLSTNKGTSWTSISAGLPRSRSVHSIVASDSIIFIASRQSGVFLSTNNGDSWSEANTGLTFHDVNFLSRKDDYVFVGTSAGSVSRRLFSDFLLSVYEHDGSKTNHFLLKQNYPNPFNSQTVIEFSIPNSSQVSLKIFDQLGRELVDMVNGFLPQGLHSRHWNATGFPSGVYFCRLQVAKNVSTTKVLFVK